MTADGAKGTARASPASGAMLHSYFDIARALVHGLTGAALLDAAFAVKGQVGSLRASLVATWLESAGGFGNSRELATSLEAADLTVAIPVRNADDAVLGTFCVQMTASVAQPAAQVHEKLRPVIDSLRRELSRDAAPSRRTREQTLSERTHELEWLFKVSQKLQGATDDAQLLEQLLAAATKRMRCAFGAMLIPDRRLNIEHAAEATAAVALRTVLEKNREQLLTWVQRNNRALTLNGSKKASQPCKMLCVPVVLTNGRVIGALVFLNPGQRADFEDKHAYLARHLGRQAASLIEAQFDLMTGLHTRAGLEQAYLQALTQAPTAARSVIYVDVDRMHVVNELHGFELGNELIVRIAALLGAPLLPEGAIAARLSGDRFGIVVSDGNAAVAQRHATRLREAVTKIAIGPESGPDSALEISVSCGIADLVDIPQGLARALAAAEIACKAAKDRGRDRVEVYASQDSSIMRRKDDVAAVGALRQALRTNSIVLYAQRIAPLQRPEEAGGYEILMRLKSADGSLVSPGPLIAAAQRYQLLPSIDRWVTQRALEMLAPYRALLKSSGLYMSINVSGQSLSDEAFAQQFTRQLKDAVLPPGSVGIEVTEQAAVSNMARAGSLLESLRASGCRVALDDFGTGANTLSALKNMQVACLKIDGSFVRDMLTNGKSRATVRGIVELAKAYHVTTVAEYVESKEIALRLKEMGVDFAQGYAYGHPRPLEDLLVALGRDESARLHRLYLES
jgi:diguanylate cyclase (GGDEF)-like protein